jgi:hypothetical protein
MPPVLIPVILFIAIQATLGINYEKTHGNGTNREARIRYER